MRTGRVMSQGHHAPIGFSTSAHVERPAARLGGHSDRLAVAGLRSHVTITGSRDVLLTAAR
jgi:hypothetical protein